MGVRVKADLMTIELTFNLPIMHEANTSELKYNPRKHFHCEIVVTKRIIYS